MKNRKVIIDREKISQREIKERGDFNNVLNQLNHTPNPFWKSTGFWGVTGLASLLIAFILPQFSLEDQEVSGQQVQISQTATTNLPADTKCITPISQKNDIPFIEHTIIAGRDTALTLVDGTIIAIDANSFDVAGEIILTTRLFQDKSSAFLAGIPMDYGNSAFESAGMIEIRGEQNGSPVTINPEHPIHVALTAYKDPNSFGFYSLDDKTGEWQDYPCEFVVNKDNNQKHIQKAESKLIEIEYNIQQVNNQLKNITTPSKHSYNLAENKANVFNLDFNERDYPELKSLGNVQFEILNSAQNTHQLFSQTWEDVNLSKNKNEWIAEFIRENKRIKVNVTPVLTGKEAEQALQHYHQALAQINQEKETLTLKEQALEADQKKKQDELNQLIKSKTEEAQYFEATRYAPDEDVAFSTKKMIPIPSIERTKKFYLDEFVGAVFSFISFGAFNIDRPIRYPSPLNLAIQFEIENEGINKPNTIFVFDLKKDVRYTFGNFSHEIDKFGFNKNNKSVVLCTFDDGTVALGNTTEIREKNGNYELILSPVEVNDLSLEIVQSFLQEKRVSV